MNRKTLLRLVLVLGITAVLLSVGVRAVYEHHDHISCNRFGTRAHHGQRAIKACIEARMANRKGPFGLGGISVAGRAAGWCAGKAMLEPDAIRRMALAVGLPPDADCVEARAASLRSSGWRDTIWGSDRPGG